MSARRAAVMALVLLVVLATSMAEAGLYWFHNVRGKTVSLCFVGDAVTSRPDRVDEVLRYLREFEYSVNVRFDYLGSCPASAVQSNGNDFFDGDIRVVIPNTSVNATVPVPGKGCPPGGGNSGWGSWSNAPDDLLKNRACLYNLKLGDDPWNDTPYLNHTLHEFGHALGLAHEHERDDVDKSCTENGYGGGATGGHMTPYDRLSVMHYQFLKCSINGNYDDTGLSPFDQISLRILYPEDNQLAEYVGATVRRTGEAVVLQSGWKVRGANLGFVAKDFNWVVNNKTVNTADLVVTLSMGSYPFQYSYTDFLDRKYSANGTIKVLSALAYDRLMGATRAAQLPLY